MEPANVISKKPPDAMRVLSYGGSLPSGDHIAVHPIAVCGRHQLARPFALVAAERPPRKDDREFCRRFDLLFEGCAHLGFGVCRHSPYSSALAKKPPLSKRSSTSS